MKNLGFYQRCFVRQTHPNSCGMACMCMVLQYTGQTGESQELAKLMDTQAFELSLLDLKKTMENYGREGRCVRFEPDRLRDIKTPIILHTVNSVGAFHFITLFEAKRINGQYFYIIGDPALDIKVIDETQLLAVCPSRAALYFDPIEAIPIENDFVLWQRAFNWDLISKPLWYFIPIFHLLSFLMGICLSVLLQQLLTARANIAHFGFRLAVVILIAISVFCKSILNHLKQQLLIKINKIINLHLTNRLASATAYPYRISGTSDKALQKELIHIGKYQLSVNSVFSIALSEGLIMLLLLGCLTFLDALAGFVSLIFAVAVAFLATKRIPNDLLFAKYLGDLHVQSEEILINVKFADADFLPKEKESFAYAYQRYINQAAKNAAVLSKSMFSNEVAGGMYIMTIMGLELFSGHLSAAFVVAVTILGYLILLVLQRMIAALPTIFDGAQSAHSLQF
ncbi:hypothetical protein IDJ75_11360 [Mucilaginibacter rigui]|uniref:Peptidase C39 domain-containing protein n=1 Tax=Mucilaginibacter rigui TaxID=534635 RepID=A0ABR7X5L4_9SPHI|nr:cysteine peptidase family C39 domain-containing protein [Mucilaginibacter rigui]MBD1385879.1 hypothetical protein [Mucilaginibacter rigui]